jgi:nitric oxide reductase NorE protein
MSDSSADVFDTLPGGLMIWVLIVSELLVFGAGLASFLAVRITDPVGFSSARMLLHPGWAGINTVILVTSGFAAALAAQTSKAPKRNSARLWLTVAATLGVFFLAIKGYEFTALAGQGISTETHVFYTFYYLLTGFHAAHVMAGIVLLGIASVSCQSNTVETVAAFWHMVDLVWVLLFPILYLLP